MAAPTNDAAPANILMAALVNYAATAITYMEALADDATAVNNRHGVTRMTQRRRIADIAFPPGDAAALVCSVASRQKAPDPAMRCRFKGLYWRPRHESAHKIQLKSHAAGQPRKRKGPRRGPRRSCRRPGNGRRRRRRRPGQASPPSAARRIRHPPLGRPAET